MKTNASSPIVLLTDFGLKDHYAGVMKGVILSIAPAAKIVDLTHEVQPHHVRQAAYLLRCSVAYFPPGSIFVAVVDPGVGTARKAIAVKTSRYFLIGPDNGIFDEVLRDEERYEVREIVRRKYFRSKDVSNTFHGRDIFASVAAHLSRNSKIFTDLGPEVTDPVRLELPPVRRLKNGLEGEIIYFDRFGNAVTNLTKCGVESVLTGKTVVTAGKYKVGPILKTYGTFKPGCLNALYNSQEDLELAWCGKSAVEKSRLRMGMKVFVQGLV